VKRLPTSSLSWGPTPTTCTSQPSVARQCLPRLAAWRYLSWATAVFAIAMGIAVAGGDAPEQTPPAPQAMPRAAAPAAGLGGTPALPHRTVNPEYPTDDMQRSVRLNTYRHFADSGVESGKTLFYYKCWMCHNKYTVASNPGQAPVLEGLFTRARLVNGQPVNDETVGAFIMAGSARMPSYKTDLSTAELTDVLAYMKTDECCTVEDKPPVNPWYRAERNKWSVPTRCEAAPRG